MRKNLILLSSLLFIAACSASALLEIPPVPGPPGKWSQFAISTLSNSNCPKIAGKYLEPPVIYQSANEANANTNDNTGSYYGHFPFHLADRKELKKGEMNLVSNQFLIRQPDADNFFFSFVTHEASIVEYHFRAKEGDFECKGGYIEFPIIRSYGMIEGKSVNSQIRNVVLRDNAGELIIQKTIGPHRGDPSTATNRFKYEFLRYQLYERFPR